MEYTDQRQSEDNKINPLTIHYGAEGSSLACWIELKALSKLFGQQMVQEDRKSWNLDSQR